MQVRQANCLAELLYPPAINHDIRGNQTYIEAFNSFKDGLSRRIRQLLQSSDKSPTERAILCQLLEDVTIPLRIPCVLAGRLVVSQDADEHMRCAKLLNQSGDVGAAIMLLHNFLRCVDFGRFEKRQSCREIFIVLHILSADFLRRVSRILDQLDLNLSKEERNTLEDPNVVIFPYSLLAGSANITFETKVFARASFTWPWIRQFVLKTWVAANFTNLDGIDWRLFFKLDSCGFKDTFGHSYLHAALLAGSDFEASSTVLRVFSKERDIAQLLSASIYGHDGLTPLAYAKAVGLGSTLSTFLSMPSYGTKM